MFLTLTFIANEWKQVKLPSVDRQITDNHDMIHPYKGTCRYTKTHWIVHFERVNLMMYELYLNKRDLDNLWVYLLKKVILSIPNSDYVTHQFKITDLLDL